MHAAPHVLPKDPFLDSIKCPARSEIRTTSRPPHRRVNTKADENVRNSSRCAYRECCAPGIARPWINPCIFNLVQLHDEVRSPPRRQRTVAGAAEQRRSLKEASTRTTTDNLVFI